MTPSRATGFTPFFMVYRSEAILPTNLEYGAPRVRVYGDQGNQASLEDAMDQLGEARDFTLLHTAKYDDTTTAACKVRHSMLWTWCFASGRTTRAATS
jgi:hypothetical protein